MESPTISIIVPVYNNENHLIKCLDSILNQSFSNIEIIVVNDGSTDKSEEICNNYVVLDKRIKVFHQKKLGVSAARNLGIEHANGEYIGFVDGDDYIDEFMFEKLFCACKESGSNISICKLGREVNGRLINQVNKEYALELDNEKAMEELFKGILYRFSLCNKLFHKSCFKEITFPVGRIHEDLSTTYKLFANANKAVYLNFIGYIYVKQKESILTKSYYEKRLDAFIGWEEIIGFMDKNYPQLYEIVNACFTFNCTDHAYFIINQVEEKKKKEKYLQSIRLYLKNHYKRSLKNSKLAYHYKFIVVFLVYNVRLFTFAHRIKSLTRVKV